MARISHHRACYHADFFTLPLGLWTIQAEKARLTQGGRHVQKRTGIPAALANLYAEMNGLGGEASR